MMRSMFAGVAGLQTHQTKMDVIGNNIANVNTVGFKGSRATFKESLSQTLANATAPTGNRGGINAQQVGLGVELGSIDVIHSPGGTQPTSSGTDLAIQGTGFFVVSDGEQNFYTRAGIMDFDGNGTLYSKVNGMTVMGYPADGSGNISDSGGHLSPIKITDELRSISPEATENVYFQGNLSAFTEINAPEPITRMATVYDSLGNTHRIVTTFAKTGENKWEWKAYLEGGDPANPAGSGEIAFNSDGSISSDENQSFNLNIAGSGASELNLTWNFSGVKQYAEENSIVVEGRDGSPSGELDTIAVDQSGIVRASYTNGRTRNLAQVALARFENPSGLVKIGDTMFQESVNSGNAVIGSANLGGFGNILANSLEMSNVDLSEQFTDMIITQRGFQANSRIISSADEMLQELVNLKR